MNWHDGNLNDGIRNLQNDDSWREFVRMYRPLIMRFSAGRRRVQGKAEGGDRTERTLAWLADFIQHYEGRLPNHRTRNEAAGK